MRMGLAIVRTPPRCPRANGIVERWIRSARRECLDRQLILNERYLRRVLAAYVRFYNERRPHQSLDQTCPVLLAQDPGHGPIERQDVLGGTLHDYYRPVV